MTIVAVAVTPLAMSPVDRLAEVTNRVAAAASAAGRPPGSVRLIAVSKTFGEEAIRPLLAAGHRVFGENRVQDAMSKWTALRHEYPDVELHLIGPLQSNKTREAIGFFDAIHTVDREKIAVTIAGEMKRQARHLRLLVEVNTGLEAQKAGVAPEETDDFVSRCQREHGLDVDGLMCIPPLDALAAPHFALLAKIGKRLGLSSLSMGMSGDFETAIALGATDIRVGSAIFGERQA